MGDGATTRSFAGVARLCLIGGGDLMAFCADAFKAEGFDVTAILAPRHAGEDLPIVGGTLADALATSVSAVQETDDINDLQTWSSDALAGADALAVCFGPSWIFSDAVIAAFGHGMVNVNPIPVPHYLGGAHFTWQILNGDRNGGCFIQDITSDLDRGDILMAHRFHVPRAARTPADYFQAYFDECCGAMQAFAKHVNDGTPLARVAYDTVNAERLYFPRLMTVEQAYIDWSWTAADIEKFCNAFDEPYAGAMTFVNGALVRVKDVARVDLDHELHPFCVGLVVRRIDGEVIVAANGGGLRIGRVLDGDGADALHLLKEGRRLITPRERLDHALAYRPKLSAKGFETGKGEGA